MELTMKMWIMLAALVALGVFNTVRLVRQGQSVGAVLKMALLGLGAGLALTITMVVLQTVQNAIA